jgi:TonB family protein
MFQPVLLCLLAAGTASAQVAGGYVPPAEKPSESGKSGEPLQIDFAAIKIRFQPPAPPYPPLAKIAGIQGTVVVDLTVDESGSPARARAIEGPPQLRACAEAYAMRWLFQPYFAGGKAIPVHFRLVMPFRLRDAPPAETRPRIGRAVFELKMLPSDLSVSLDRESLQAEARKVLTDGGITLVEASSADPKTTHHLWLGIQTLRMADGSYGCTVMQRCSLLSDLLITNNAPGQPPRVWSSQQLLAQQSLEGFPENIAKAALRTLRSTVAPPLMMVSVDPSKVAVAGSSPAGEKNGGPSAKKVVDFDFAQLKVRRQPPAPAYPTLAKLMGIQGVVVVELVIDPAGKPVRAEAIAGPSELQAAAVGYALQWEFEPAKLNGVPQTAKFRLTMPFNLRTDPPPPAAPPRP